MHYEDYVLSIQYFNQVLAQKPYLYEPWQLRAIAKFCLDDFAGAEADASEAILLNPYVPELYDLRGVSRIRQRKFTEAIHDYTTAIKADPINRNYWYNRAICRMENKEYKQAQTELDTIIGRWNSFAAAYALKAEVCMQQKDTTEAAKWLDKSLETDPYNGEAWAMRGVIALSPITI